MLSIYYKNLCFCYFDKHEFDAIFLLQRKISEVFLYFSLITLFAKLKRPDTITLEI